MMLGLAESKLAGGSAAGRTGAARGDARRWRSTLEELRELSQGIRPAILVERGLAAALDDLSRRAALPVRLEVSIDGRLSEQVEAAAYFVASEALTNAAKHSHASQVRLCASHDDGTLHARDRRRRHRRRRARRAARGCAASPTASRRSADG